MQFAALPPEVNSGLMYAGSGAGPLLAAATGWDALAAELHSAAAGYRSVITGLTSEGWMGPASATMAAAAAPYAAWMSATAAQAEQTASQARAAVGAYEAAFAATVPPLVIAENRAQLAMLIATNVLGQNTPAIAATEAQYGEMWAQDVSAMYGYDAAAKPASVLNPFSQPPQTANPAGSLAEAGAVTQSAGTAAGTQAQSLVPQLAATAPSSGGSPVLPGVDLTGTAANTQDALRWAMFVPQGSNYLFGIVNAMNSLGRSLFGGAGAAAGAAAAVNGAAGSAGLGSLASAVTAGLGHSGTIGGALSVPQAWAAASPVTGSLGSALTGGGLGAASAAGAAHPGMLSGLPMLANAAARGVGAHTASLPRFDLRPSVIPISPAAG